MTTSAASEPSLTCLIGNESSQSGIWKYFSFVTNGDRKQEYTRNGTCLHYSEWNRKKQAGISKDELFVEYVVKNPLCSMNEPIQSELFCTKLDGFIRSLPFFSARAG
ncbi:TPPC1 protein, partial [Polypterus senegalus]